LIAATKQITAFRLDPDILGAMKKLQERDGISFSEQARRALRPWLESEGVLKRTYPAGTATWRRHLHRVIDEADLLNERLVAFRQGRVTSQRLEVLKDIAARVRTWAINASDFVAQARGSAQDPPEIDWDTQSHAEIRKVLERFLGVRSDLEKLLTR